MLFSVQLIFLIIYSLNHVSSAPAPAQPPPASPKAPSMAVKTTSTKQNNNDQEVTARQDRFECGTDDDNEHRNKTTHVSLLESGWNDKWADLNILIEYDDFSKDQVKLIRDAVWEFEGILGPCGVNVKMYNKGNLPDKEDYIHIRSGLNCKSAIGRQGGDQSLTIDGKSCMKSWIIIHELMHALGFMHEHRRPDRDEHVVIHWDNIQPDKRHHFGKVKTHWGVKYDLPYNFKSIMHYDGTAFAINPMKPTITAKKNGQSVGFAWTNCEKEDLHCLFTEPDRELVRKRYCSTSNN